ncbi:hypothetical protein GCM10010946_07760 [Undibacterium squillarum]|uniref:PilZ domain-containing protein n=2 Tax=Undibacterium squillarum TaxID=1131567 RepID=A0ABQ2XTY0_9BURK|nr:hypothetical protein GCM10010946_07760 [Undibacterium squillarum]
MGMNTAEKRQFQRVQFFRLTRDREFVPVWVFNKQPQDDAVTGLIVDLSDSGVQVMTVWEDRPQSSAWMVHLLDNHGDRMQMPAVRLDYVWSAQHESLYARTGFRFHTAQEGAAGLLQALIANQPQQVLRCQLTPVFQCHH